MVAKEAKELLKVVILAGMATEKSFADNGKLGTEDMGNFLPVLMALPEGINGIGLVIEEIKNLDEAGKNDLYSYIATELNLINKPVEAIIEHSIALLGSIYSLVLEIKNLKNA